MFNESFVPLVVRKPENNFELKTKMSKPDLISYRNSNELNQCQELRYLILAKRKDPEYEYQL